MQIRSCIICAIINNMRLDKLIPVENKKLTVELTGVKYFLPENLQQRIDDHWDGIVSGNKHLFRGEVFVVSDIKASKDNIRIKLDVSDYAHYIYGRKVGLPEKYVCKNLHTSCLIETADSVLVFGKMGEGTELPGKMQCAGGGLDNDDICGSKVSLEHNIKKELLEEVGIDVGDRTMVSDFDLKYLKGSAKTNSLAAIFILKLKITAREIAKLYAQLERRLEREKLLPEFSELVYLQKNRVAVNEFYAKEKSHFDQYLEALLNAVVE